jgi:hypothetical protein
MDAMTIESYRNSWNQQQQALRRILLSGSQHDEAIQLFLIQHAALHSSKVAQSAPWSFEDAVLDDMTEEQIRRIPRKLEHSVAWVIWHLARIEDVTMNVLLAGQPQILRRDNWLERMKVTVQDTGNAMDEAAVAELSATIDFKALRAYRVAVGRGTRATVQQLQPEQLKQKVEPSRLQQLMDEGAVAEESRGLLDYWGRQKIAGLLLMPPTRHNFIHLNEALRIKRRQ